MIEPTTITSLAALALSTGVAVYNWRRNVNADTEAIWEAVNLLKTDMALVKKQGDLFWGLIEQQMAKALIRPTHIEMDKLLEKVIKNEQLSRVDETRLQKMLHETVLDKQEQAGVRAMAATILAIRQARQQQYQAI